MNNEYEYKRALIFFKNKTLVHISKNTGFWCNGIIKNVDKEYFIIEDREDKIDKYIFFDELKKEIEPFKPPK